MFFLHFGSMRPPPNPAPSHGKVIDCDIAVFLYKMNKNVHICLFGWIYDNCTDKNHMKIWRQIFRHICQHENICCQNMPIICTFWQKYSHFLMIIVGVGLSPNWNKPNIYVYRLAPSDLKTLQNVQKHHYVFTNTATLRLMVMSWIYNLYMYIQEKS